MRRSAPPARRYEELRNDATRAQWVEPAIDPILVQTRGFSYKVVNRKSLEQLNRPECTLLGAVGR
jgi:hypothetical protein